MRQKTKRLGLCLLLVLTLLLGGCQTSAVKQEQASTETAAADTAEQKQETTEREDTKEPEYIDGDYVDEHYGDPGRGGSEQILRPALPQRQPQAVRVQAELPEVMETRQEQARPVRQPARITTIQTRFRKESRSR